MSYLEELQKAIKSIICTEEVEVSYESMMESFLQLLGERKRRKRTLYFIGNGGSAAISVHMTSDFLKNGGIRTHSMHDPAVLTCLGNDFSFDEIFSRQLDLVAEEQDVLVAISSSGRSQNILHAVETAKNKGCKIVTLSGFRQDNPLRRMGDINIYVPSMKYGIVESIHNMILQQVVDEIVARDGVGMK